MYRHEPNADNKNVKPLPIGARFKLGKDTFTVTSDPIDANYFGRIYFTVQKDGGKINSNRFLDQIKDATVL